MPFQYGNQYRKHNKRDLSKTEVQSKSTETKERLDRFAYAKDNNIDLKEFE